MVAIADVRSRVTGEENGLAEIIQICSGQGSGQLVRFTVRSIHSVIPYGTHVVVCAGQTELARVLDILTPPGHQSPTGLVKMLIGQHGYCIGVHRRGTNRALLFDSAQ